jgi:hypothetical protein
MSDLPGLYLGVPVVYTPAAGEYSTAKAGMVSKIINIVTGVVNISLAADGVELATLKVKKSVTYDAGQSAGTWKLAG